MKEDNMVRVSAAEVFARGLTAEDHKQLDALSKMSDADIDYSDSPPLEPGAMFVRPGALYLGPKEEITIRLDADLLDFFTVRGVRSDRWLNLALRDYMKRMKDMQARVKEEERVAKVG